MLRELYTNDIGRWQSHIVSETPNAQLEAELYLRELEYESLSDVLLELESQIVDEYGVRTAYARFVEDEMFGVEPCTTPFEFGQSNLYSTAKLSITDAPTPSSVCGKKRKYDEVEDVDDRQAIADIEEGWTAPPPGQGKPKRPLGENQIYLHSIQWNTAPPRWAGQELPQMPITHVLGHVMDTFKRQKGTVARCRLNGCMKVYEHEAALRNHLRSQDHFNIRIKCLTCEYDTREDNFGGRHHCAKRLKRLQMTQTPQHEEEDDIKV